MNAINKSNRFPVAIQGEGFVDATYSDGVWTIGWDAASIQSIGVGEDPGEFLSYNEATETYGRVSFADTPTATAGTDTTQPVHSAGVAAAIADKIDTTALFVGLASDVAGRAIPAVTQRIRTEGYAAAGKGAAIYERHTVATSGGLTSNSGAVFWRLVSMVVDPYMFGAVGDGVADDTSAIQAAIDFQHARGGGVVEMVARAYKMARAGMYLGRGYCIKTKSGVALSGASGGTTLSYVADATDTDGVITEQVGALGALTQTDVALTDITVDGGSSGGASGGGMNFWFRTTERLSLMRVYSRRSTSWGMRIQQCDRVKIDMRSDQVADVNADGVHFIDTNNVIFDGDIYTQGDDAMAIETLQYPVENYLIRARLSAPTAGISAGRGLLLLHEPTNSSAAREMKNIVADIVCSSCYQGAVAATGSLLLSNISVRAVAQSCGNGAYLSIGNTTTSVPGSMRNCTFDITARNSTGYGFISIDNVGSVIEDNRIRADVREPGDAGSVGVSLKGNRWSGAIAVNYDPEADNTSNSLAIDIHGSNNSLDIPYVIGGTIGLYIRTTAQYGAYRLGTISGQITAPIEIVSGHTAPPSFVGGRVSGTITNASLGRWLGVDGAGRYTIDAAPSGGGVQSSVTDNGAGKLLTVGAFGVGATQPTTPTDLDSTTIYSGYYRVNAATTTAGTWPGGSAFSGLLEVQRYDGGTVMQVLHETATACRQWRRRYSGGWGAWQGPF